MSENFEFNVDELLEKIEDTIEDALQESIDSVITTTVHDALSEALNDGLAGFEFVLKDGTVVRPRHKMRLLSQNKCAMFLCYGGLKVDGKSLLVQTRASCWEYAGSYPTEDEAKEALLKVKEAMDSGAASYEL